MEDGCVGSISEGNFVVCSVLHGGLIPSGLAWLGFFLRRTETTLVMMVMLMIK